MRKKVIYNGREAELSRYFDLECLLFDTAGGKPPFGDEVIRQYPDMPDKYVVYLGNLSIEDRNNIKDIKDIDESDSAIGECICKNFGTGDSPHLLAQKGLIEIIGEDPLEYDKGDFASSIPKAHVRCLACGQEYRVNIKQGYRTSYFNWER